MITLLIIVMYFVIGMIIARKIYHHQDAKGKLCRQWTEKSSWNKRNPKPRGAGLIVITYATIWPLLGLVYVLAVVPERIGYWVGESQ